MRRRDRRRRTRSWHASCSTPTTSTPPSRSSTPGTSPAKRPPTRTRGRLLREAYAAFNRHELPASGLGHHRSPAGYPVRVQHHDRDPPRHLGPHARPQHSDRGGASAQQSRSGRHPCGDMGPRRKASTPSGGAIELLTVDGDRINRCEIFDEADLDAALARFDELQPQAPRLENAASQVHDAPQGVLRGPRLGRHGASSSPTTLPSTIAVGS